MLVLKDLFLKISVLIVVSRFACGILKDSACGDTGIYIHNSLKYEIFLIYFLF